MGNITIRELHSDGGGGDGRRRRHEVGIGVVTWPGGRRGWWW